MSDVFASAREYTEVTKSDTNVVGFQALYVGTAGDVVISPNSGTTSITFANVAAGTTLPISGNRVMAATSASDIVALSW